MQAGLPVQRSTVVLLAEVTVLDLILVIVGTTMLLVSVKVLLRYDMSDSIAPRRAEPQITNLVLPAMVSVMVAVCSGTCRYAEQKAVV